MDSDLNGIYLIFNSVMNWLKTLPWSTVIVGIVVPIASAYISYNLAENSIRRKENNRLNVYIEFVKKVDWQALFGQNYSEQEITFTTVLILLT